eukprot:10289721-Alexandrium_andersonii.AAC.1
MRFFLFRKAHFQAGPQCQGATSRTPEVHFAPSRIALCRVLPFPAKGMSKWFKHRPLRQFSSRRGRCRDRR